MSNIQRQHPLMIVTGVISQLKGLIWPILLVFLARFLGSDQSGPFFDRFTLIFTGVTLGGTFLFSLLRWIFFTYRYDAHLIEIKSGVFIKKERKIKRERIQAISLDTHILLKLLGLTTLKVETAGNLNEAELSIQVMKLEDAKALKETLSSNGHDALNESEAHSALVEVDTNTLFIAGLTSGGVGVTSLAVLFFAFQIISMVDTFEVDFSGTWQILLALLFGVFLVVLTGWIISIIRYVLQYANFTLTRDERDLTITRGLIRKKEVMLSLERVQAISLIQGMIRQPLGYLTIEAKVAGARSEDNLSSTILHPLIHEREILAFMQHLFPQYELPESYERAPKRALIRYLFRASLLFVFLSPLYFLVPYGWAILAVWPLFLGLAMLKYRSAGVALTDSQCSLRYRVVAKTQFFVPRAHIQACHIQANPLQRWRKLKDVGVYVLSSPSPTFAMVKDLSETTVNEVFLSLSPQAHTITQTPS